ncbi:hypothetical protein [Dickeya poaceiphila]|uniref:Uncharacterized protein n=1 Tax=Dickeya poaceiphila TaxID=568768 RepID=A0A5B8IHS4_9GAMM|nr:hypothetical protein [Dickeya poaceiphila]QDX31220.1 hypothetical protein Dpoa569_0003211 [Dickeya poaceiphila]
MVITMILKKRFIKWLCLPIAIRMASIPSSYALTGEQYKMLIYGAAAAGAWGAWGTLNSVLTYVTRGDHTITTADGANAIGTICGATAAATFRLWNPPTDPVSAANVVMAATKAGAIPGAATACRWVSNAFLQIYFTEAQNSGRRLSTTQRNRLSADATRVAMLRDQVGAKIDAAGPKIRAANNATFIYNYRCLNAIGVTK